MSIPGTELNTLFTMPKTSKTIKINYVPGI